MGNFLCMMMLRSYLFVSESVILISVKMNTEIINPFSMAINIYARGVEVCSVQCLPPTIFMRWSHAVSCMQC